MNAEDTTSSIDGILNHLRNLALFAILVLGLMSLAVLWFEVTTDPKTQFLSHGSLKIIFSILTGFLPPLIIVALIKPIYDWLIKIKASEVKEKARREYEAIINNGLNNLTNHINGKFESLASAHENPSPIRKFYSSFYDIEWDAILSGAKSIDLCAFYWSDEWMQQNLPLFSKALERDIGINLYLPNPIRYSSEFTLQTEQNEKTRGRILKTIFSFLALSAPGNRKVSVILVPHTINYMLARTSYNDGTTFMYSPFMNNEESHIGKPPVVLIDEDKAENKLKSYIEGEIEHLSRGQDLIDFELSKYITWADDNSRLIVSMALTCPANCKFCYIDSVLDGDEIVVEDGKLLGILLAYSIVNDKRFRGGVNGTTILVGGLSDPFYKNNTVTTRTFLKTLRDLSIDNVIHIATRFCADNIDLLNEISSSDNLIINYSVTSLSGDLTMGSKHVEKRFAEAKSLAAKGIFGALYIRPVIPGVTIADIPEIIKRAKDSGIKHVTVGGLYFDKRITESLEASGVEFNPNEITQSKFIMDRKDKLRKLEYAEVENIKNLLRKAGLEVFGSSKEIASYRKRQIS